MPINNELKAALDHLATREGVTAEQVTNLSETISASTVLTQELNAVAAAGRLQRFELAGADATGNRVGTYSIASGTIMLPAQSLQTPGNGPFNRADLASVLKVQEMAVQLAQKSGVNQDAIDNLQNTINESPVLAEQVKTAVNGSALLTEDVAQANSQRHLRALDLMPAGHNAGGYVDPSTRTIHLGLSSIQRAPSGTFDPGNMTFVMGHEVQHTLNRAAMGASYAQFGTELRSVALGPAPHDYTTPINNILKANAWDEASAEIAGYNALHSRVHTNNPAATLSDVYAASPGRMQDFIDNTPAMTRTPDGKQTLTWNSAGKPLLAFNADHSLSDTPANLSAMEQYYFHKAPGSTRIGHNGNSDYPNYYGAFAVTQTIAYERWQPAPGDIHLNMGALKLDESLLEQNGISLGAAPGNATPQVYYDTGQTPPTRHGFDHTIGTHVHVPDPQQQNQGQGQTAPPTPVLRPQHPTHPDYPLYQQALEGVHRLDAAAGRTPDATSEQIAHNLLYLAKSHGMDRIDEVCLGGQRNENIFVVKGRPNDPAMSRMRMSMQEAISIPIEESLRKLEMLNPQYERNPQTQQQTQEQESPTVEAPAGHKPKL